MMSNPGAEQGLKHYKGVDGNADAMMWVRKTPFWSNGKPSQYQDHCCEEDGDDLEPDVGPERQNGISMVETSDHDCGGDDEEEGNCCHDTVAGNDVMVLRDACEPIAHAIVSHDVEGKSDEIGE